MLNQPNSNETALTSIKRQQIVDQLGGSEQAQQIVQQAESSGAIDLSTMDVEAAVGIVAQLGQQQSVASSQAPGWWDVVSGQTWNPANSAVFGQNVNQGQSRGIVREAHAATLMAHREMDPMYQGMGDRVMDAAEDAFKSAAWHFADSATMGIIGAIGELGKKWGGAETNFWTENNSWRETHTKAGQIAKWGGNIVGMFAPGAPFKAAAGLARAGVKAGATGVLGVGNAVREAGVLRGAIAEGKAVADASAKLAKLESKIAKAGTAMRENKVIKALDTTAEILENPTGKWAHDSIGKTVAQTIANLTTNDAAFNSARALFGKVGGKLVRNIPGTGFNKINRAAEIGGVAAKLKPGIIKAAERLGIDVSPDQVNRLAAHISPALDDALDSVAATRQGVKRLDAGSKVMETIKESGTNYFLMRFGGEMASEVGEEAAIKILNNLDDLVKEEVGNLISGKAGAGLAELAYRSGGKGAFAKEAMTRLAGHAGTQAAGFAVSGTYERFWRAVGEPQLYMQGEDEGLSGAFRYAVKGYEDGGWREGVRGDLFSGVVFGAGGGTIRLIPGLAAETDGIARTMSKLLGGSHDDWKNVVGESQMAMDKIMGYARKASKNPLKLWKRHGIDLDLLTDKELAIVADNYRGYLSRFGHKDVLGMKGLEPGGSRYVNKNAIERLSDGTLSAEARASARTEILSKLKKEQDELLTAWAKGGAKMVTRDIARSAAVAIPLFYMMGGGSVAREYFKTHDADAAGNMLTQLAMAFAAAGGPMPRQDGSVNAKLDRNGIPDAEMPGMTKQWIMRNRLKEQLRHLGTYDASLVLTDNDAATPSAVRGIAAENTANLIRRVAARMPRYGTEKDPDGNVKHIRDRVDAADDQFKVLEPGELPANDGKVYIPVESLRNVAAYLRGAAAAGAELPASMRNDGGDKITGKAWWNTAYDNLDANDIQQLARFTYHLQSELGGTMIGGERYSKNTPISRNHILHLESDARLDIMHSTGIEVDDAMASLASKQRDMMARGDGGDGKTSGEQGGTPTFRRMRIAGLHGGWEQSGLSKEDYDMVLEYQAKEDRLFAVADVVSAGNTDSRLESGHPVTFESPGSSQFGEAVVERNRRNVEMIRELSSQIDKVEERLNTSLGLPHKFTFKNDSTARLFLEMAAEGGRDMARMFVLEGGRLSYDDGGKRYWGSFNDVTRHLSGTVLRTDGNTMFINGNIDFEGMSFAQRKAAMGLLRVLEATKGFRVDNSPGLPRINGKEVFGRQIAVTDGPTNNRNILQHLEAMGFHMYDDAAVSRYINGIATANMAKASFNALEIYNKLSENGHIRQDDRGRRLIYVPQVMAQDAMIAAASKASIEAISNAQLYLNKLRENMAPSDVIGMAEIARLKTILGVEHGDALLSGGKVTVEEAIAGIQRGFDNGIGLLPKMESSLSVQQAIVLDMYAREMVAAGLIDGIARTDFEPRGNGDIDKVYIYTEGSAQNGIGDIQRILSEVSTRTNFEAMREVENGIQMLDDIIRGPSSPAVSKESAQRLLVMMRQFLARGDAYNYRRMMDVLSAKGVDMFVLDTGTNTYRVNQDFKIADAASAINFVSEYFSMTRSLSAKDALTAMREYGTASAAAVGRGFEQFIKPSDRDRGATIGQFMRDLGVPHAEKHAVMRETVRQEVADARAKNGGRLTVDSIRAIGENIRSRLLAEVAANNDNASQDGVDARTKMVEDLGDHDFLSMIGGVVESRLSFRMKYTGGDVTVGKIKHEVLDENSTTDIKRQAINEKHDAYSSLHVEEEMADYNLEHHLSDIMDGHRVGRLDTRVGRIGQDPGSYDLMDAGRHSEMQNVLDYIFDGDGKATYSIKSEDGSLRKGRVAREAYGQRRIGVIVGDVGIITHDIPDIGNARKFSSALMRIFGLSGYNADAPETTRFAIERGGLASRLNKGRASELLSSVKETLHELLTLADGQDTARWDQWVVANRGKLEQVFYAITSYGQFGADAMARNLNGMSSEESVKSLFSRIHQMAGQGPRRYNADLLDAASQMAAERDARKAQTLDEDARRAGRNGDSYGYFAERFGVNNGRIRMIVVDDSFDGNKDLYDGQTWISPHLAHAMAMASGYDTSRHEYGAIKALVHSFGDGDSALMAKTLFSVNTSAHALMRANDVAMVITKSAAKAMFGEFSGKTAEFIDANGNRLNLQQAMAEATVGRNASLSNGGQVIELDASKIRFQNMVHHDVKEATVTWQMENGWSETAVKAMTDAYMAGGNVGLGMSLIRRMTEGNIGGRMSARNLVVGRNDWHLYDGIDDTTVNIQKAYLMASKLASPNDIGMSTKFVDQLKSTMLKDNVFKGRSRNGGNAPLSADIHGALESREMVVGHHYMNRELDTHAIDNMHIGFKAIGDNANQESADEMAKEYGFRGRNMYNNGPAQVDANGNQVMDANGNPQDRHTSQEMLDRETSWRSYSLTKKASDGNGGFYYQAIKHLAATGSRLSDRRSTSFAKDIRGLDAARAERIAESVNNAAIDVLRGIDSDAAYTRIEGSLEGLGSRARADVKAMLTKLSIGNGRGKLDLGSIYEASNNLFGAVNDSGGTVGYQYGRRIKDANGKEMSEKGRTSLEFGVVAMSQRSPSNRVNDTMPMHILGFADKVAGNQIYMSRKDAVPIAEADFDKDSFNFFWDTPKEMLSEAFRLANSSLPLSQITGDMSNVDAKDRPNVQGTFGQNAYLVPGEHDYRNMNNNAAYKYAVHARRSNSLRGQLVKANRLGLHMINLGASLEFEHGEGRFRRRFRLVPKFNREDLIANSANHEALLRLQQRVQIVLDSKKTGLPERMMDRNFNPLKEALGEFFKVEELQATRISDKGVSKETVSWSDTNESMPEALDAMMAISRVYGKVMGLANDGFEGADQVSRSFGDIAGDAFTYANIMNGDTQKIEANLASRMAYYLQFVADADQKSGVHKAIYDGLERGTTRVRLNTGTGSQDLHRSAIDAVVKGVLDMASSVEEGVLNSWAPDGVHNYVKRVGMGYIMKADARAGDADMEGLLRLRQFQGDLQMVEDKLVRLARESEWDPAARQEFGEVQAQYDIQLARQAEDRLLPVRELSGQEKIAKVKQFHDALAVAAAKVMGGQYSQDDMYLQQAVSAVLAERNKLMAKKMSQIRNGTGGFTDRVNDEVLDGALEVMIRGLDARWGADRYNLIMQLITPEIDNSPFSHKGQIFNSYKRVPMDILRVLANVYGPNDATLKRVFSDLAEAHTVVDGLSNGDAAAMLVALQKVAGQDSDIALGSLTRRAYNNNLTMRMERIALEDALRSSDERIGAESAIGRIETILNELGDERNTMDRTVGARPHLAIDQSRSNRQLFDKSGLFDRDQLIDGHSSFGGRYADQPQSVLQSAKNRLQGTAGDGMISFGVRQNVGYQAPGAESQVRWLEQKWREDTGAKSWESPDPAKQQEIAMAANRRATNILKATVMAMRRIKDPTATSIMDRNMSMRLKSVFETVDESLAQKECDLGSL